jgi:hypothetical protein
MHLDGWATHHGIGRVARVPIGKHHGVTIAGMYERPVLRSDADTGYLDLEQIFAGRRIEADILLGESGRHATCK